MTRGSALRDRLSADAFLSDESAELVYPIRRLLLLQYAARERCMTMSLMESESVALSNSLADRFKSLAKTWHEECDHLSSVREMVLHPAYQQIVRMGQDALPFIFAELKRETDHWFWALRAITGHNPVPPEHQGSMTEMAEDWLQWAEKTGMR